MFNTLVILGCTASGKSDLAESLAARTHASLMAVDSMQLYRHLDIGTAKPTPETQKRFHYLMLDRADPWKGAEPYSAARFITEARPLLPSIHEPRTTTHDPRPTILVAGTILYLRALIEGLFEGPSADEPLRQKLQARATAEGSAPLHADLARIDPLAAQRIHQNDLRRIIRALEVHQLTGTPISTLQTQWSQQNPPIRATYIGIRREKEALNRRINARVKKMLELGLVEEVKNLHDDPRGLLDEAASAVGYRQLLDHLAGKSTLEEAVEQIKIQTRYLAKMQRTWLKRWPPPGQVHWLDATDDTPLESLTDQALQIAQSAQSSQ